MGPRPNISRVRMFSGLHTDLAGGTETGTGTDTGTGAESSLDLLISASFPSVPLSDFTVRRKPAESTEIERHFHGILLQTFDENLIDSARYENPYNYESQIEKEVDEIENEEEDDDAAIEARHMNKIKIESKIKEKKLLYEGENEGENEGVKEEEKEEERDLELSSESIASDLLNPDMKGSQEGNGEGAAKKGGDKEEEGDKAGRDAGQGEDRELDLEMSMDRDDAEGGCTALVMLLL